MRKQTKKIAFAVMLSMAMSFVAPSQMSALAATQTFEYAEEKTGEAIKELALEQGEQFDLKPIGVEVDKTCKWTSSNTKVAVVDSMGMITAMGKGTATITMTVGDGKEYTSVGVKVSVGEEREITIGVLESVFGYEMENGTSVEFNFFGLSDGVEGRYECEWKSTNPSVATVDDSGKVTAVEEGFTVLSLTVKNKTTKTEYEARPIAISVVKNTTGVTVTPTPKVTSTPAPTQVITPVPTATATPIPTQVATPTPTVTAGQTVNYTATLEADNCILLKFYKKVAVDDLDITLKKLVEIDKNIMEVNVLFKLEQSSDGTEVRLYSLNDSFENGLQYVVRVGETARTILVDVGEPNRVEVTYECLGEKGKAYAYDSELGLDVPVTLSYQLYYNTVNVTESYKNNGYVEYELVYAKDPDNVDLTGDTLNFYSTTYATIKAVYYYQDENGDFKECKNTKPISVAAIKLPTYKVEGLVDWTVIDTTETTQIDWTKTVKSTIANSENQKVVALLCDNYGRYYVTDERGADEENGIYYVDDGEQLFALLGYRAEFSFKIGENDFIIESDGDLITYQTVKNGNAYLNIINEETGKTREYNVFPLEVKASSKLSELALSTNSVSIASQALLGFEDRFSTAEVEILLKDQYGKEWTGDFNLELSSNVTEVNDILFGSTSDPAYIIGTTLYIDAENIMSVTSRKTLSFTVTETTTKRSAKVTVTLKSPKLSDTGEIVVNASQIGLKENAITLVDTTAEDVTRAAELEIFKISSGVKVGLYSANDMIVQENSNHKFTVDNCEEGQIYILVLDPQGKPVKEAVNEDSVGVWIDSNDDCVKINVAGQDSEDSSKVEFLQAGRYTIKVTRITEVSDNRVQKTVVTPTALYFNVEDNTNDVTFLGLKDRKTDIIVSGADDVESVKQIVAELFRFRLGGKEWTELTTDMITNVKFKSSKEYLVVMDVEFAVPYGTEDLGMSYTKVLSGLNENIVFDTDN